MGIGAVGLGSDKFTFGRKAPEVGAAGMEVGASQGAEGTDELPGIGVVKSGARKLQQKLLESLVRLRRVAGTRVSGVSCQCAPIVLAKRLKTLELHIKPTLDSQIESREYAVAVPTCEMSPK
ncbi:MAG: hypothetical protein ACLP0H_12085 [Terriglobales bacterium]